MSGLRTLSWAFTVLLVLTSGQNQQRLGSPARTLRDVLLGTGRGGMRAPVVEETDHCQGEHQCTGHWIQPWGKGMDVGQVYGCGARDAPSGMPGTAGSTGSGEG